MKPKTSINIAILSDVHAFSDDDQSPSWINLADDQANPKTNPFAGLHDLLARDQNIAADVTVCGGDLGDKACSKSQQYVWQEVNRLLQPLRASKLLATAGNHDVDSRFVNTKFDARGQIQALEPPFPIADRALWMEYWAQNYTIFEHGGARFVLLNSASYHGYTPPAALPEYHHGRISDRTLDRMIQNLKALGRHVANVMVCHHHPLKNDQIKIDDYSDMKNGDRLINALVDAKVGPWLLIHGHKHLPRLIHAPGGNTSPTIFSAGSFSAKLYPEYGDRARNEFYILKLEIPSATGSTSSLKGTIATWQWTYGNGWQRSHAGHGLGPTAAFGARVDVAEEATKVAASLKSHHAGLSIPWAEICTKHPVLKHLIPDDLDSFLEHLQSDHGCNSLHDRFGVVSEIKVPANV